MTEHISISVPFSHAGDVTELVVVVSYDWPNILLRGVNMHNLVVDSISKVPFTCDADLMLELMQAMVGNSRPAVVRSFFREIPVNRMVDYVFAK